MNKVEGLHHLAIATADIKGQIEFFTDKLGMELARFKRSSDYADAAGTVPQPGPDAPGPHMSNYPPGRYAKILALSDEQMLAASENQPPVPPG